MRFAIPALLTLAIAAVAHAGPTRLAPPIVDEIKLRAGCYAIIGPTGEVGTVGVYPTRTGQTWSSEGEYGTFTGGQIWYGDSAFGSVEVHDLDGDGHGDVADLDFEGLPSGMPTHYTLEPCFGSRPAEMPDERNPFRVITS